VKLECKRLTLLELQVVDMGLRRDFDALLLDKLLVRFANQRLERFLPDRVAKLLPDYGRWRLSWPEARKPDSRGVPSGGFVLRVLYRFGWNRDLDVTLDSFRRARGELYLHARNITVAQRG